MLNIEYELTPDDYAAFNLFTMQHSPTFKRQLKLARYIPPIIFLIGWCYILISAIPRGFKTYTIVALALLFAFAIAWILLMPASYRRNIRKTASKMSMEGSRKGIFGKTAITFTSDEIAIVRKDEEIKAKWGILSNIVENDTHIFMYSSSVEALVIPKRAFESDSAIASFLETVRQYKAQSEG